MSINPAIVNAKTGYPREIVGAALAFVSKLEEPHEDESPFTTRLRAAVDNFRKNCPEYSASDLVLLTPEASSDLRVFGERELNQPPPLERNDQIRQDLLSIIKRCQNCPNNRPLSIAITHLQTALLWLDQTPESTRKML